MPLEGRVPPLAVRDGVQLRRLDQLRARRTHAHPPPPAHRTLGRRPYAACDGLCWQFRHCLVAGTNRKLHVCPGRYGTVVGSRVRGRSRDARPGVSSLLPVTCCYTLYSIQHYTASLSQEDSGSGLVHPGDTKCHQMNTENILSDDEETTTKWSLKICQNDKNKILLLVNARQYATRRRRPTG